MFEIQDKHNPSKVWVIRYNEEHNHYEWNQKIDGNLFYDTFAHVTLSWIKQCLGERVAGRLKAALRPNECTMKELQAEISEELQMAKRRAQRTCKCIRFEPYLLAIKDEGRVSDPIFYSGKLTRKLIEKTLANFPDADELWYANDLDGANSLLDFEYGNYDPSIENVDVLIWKK